MLIGVLRSMLKLRGVLEGLLGVLTLRLDWLKRGVVDVAPS
jgi:hypothetical protein